RAGAGADRRGSGALGYPDPDHHGLAGDPAPPRGEGLPAKADGSLRPPRRGQGALRAPVGPGLARRPPALAPLGWPAPRPISPAGRSGTRAAQTRGAALLGRAGDLVGPGSGA